jgi:hypothetical protein
MTLKGDPKYRRVRQLRGHLQIQAQKTSRRNVDEFDRPRSSELLIYYSMQAGPVILDTATAS